MGSSGRRSDEIAGHARDSGVPSESKFLASNRQIGCLVALALHLCFEKMKPDPDIGAGLGRFTRLLTLLHPAQLQEYGTP